MRVTIAQLKATLEGHTKVVWSVAFSPDGKTLASGSWDQTVRLWDVDTEQLLHTLTEHTNEVVSVAFSTDDTLASGDWDGTIRLWNPHTGKLKRTLTDHRGGITSVAFSPDDSILASGSADQTIRLWNPHTGKLLHTFTEHTDRVESVAFSSDGTILASASYDHTIRLWNPHSKQLLHTLTKHTAEVVRLAFSPVTLASSSRDGTIRLWNPHTGKQKRKLTVQTGWVNPVAFSPDGATLLIGGHGITVWDTDIGQYKVPLIGGIGDVVSVVFSPDGQTVACGSADNLVHLLESTPPEVPFESVPFDINNIPEPVPPPPVVRDFFDLDPFYQQWISVAGFPILASAKVSPYALKEVAYVVWQMIGHRRDLLKAMAWNKIRLPVIAYNEIVCQIPEHKERIDPAFCFFPEVRARASFCPGCLTVTANEENLLNYRIGAPSTYSVLVHEFAHALHEAGLNTIAPEFDNRLRASYNSAMEKGLWAGSYATSNMSEYWAEAVGSWFNAVHYDNPVKTQSALKTYDPALATLLTEVFGNSDWRYTPSTTRTHLPHLQGFNPQNSPIFQRDPESVRVYEQLKDPNSDGGGRWIDFKLYSPSRLSNLKQPTTTGDHTKFFLVNLLGDELSLYFVNADGTAHFGYRNAVGGINEFASRVGGIWLIKDRNGEAFAVFQAEKKRGRVLISAETALITPGLSKISGDNQAGMSGATLTNPFVIEVRDENLSTLEGISVTFTVTAGGGTLNTTHTTTDENGRAESTLTLGPNRGTNTVSISAAGIEGTVTFNTTAEAAVALPDQNLRAAIETALGKAKGDPITPSEMATLTDLVAKNANISDLTGLEFATNLTFLWLENNNITDISSVTGLTKLTRLDFGNNFIADISPVAGLDNLTSLWLWDNSISDISSVTGLTNLTKLGLWGNSISDISPLVANIGLGSGDTVYVRGNPLSYLSIHTHIPILKNRGVKIEFDNQAHPALLKISGDNQKGASFAPLSQPFVVEAQNANGSALAGFSVRFAVTAGGGTLSTTITRTDENGRAQSTLVLGPNLGTNTVEVSAAGIESTATFYAIADTELPPMTADVNNDGSVNVLDLVVIASELGNTGINLAVDVNGDGVINVLDLILVAGMFEGAAAAPSAQPQVPETLTAVEVQRWLTDARALEVRDPIMKRGFLVLEQLLVALTPKETELLSNYPNPFNPETWIPYRLAKDANVTLTIYDSSGQVIRTLDVGYRIAAAYENRSKAVYWDGRNELGEPVASGIYFYTLTARDFSATRRMVILK